jgi:hypothetical protein
MVIVNCTCNDYSTMVKEDVIVYFIRSIGKTNRVKDDHVMKHCKYVIMLSAAHMITLILLKFYECWYIK